jgi:parvulin-like peptidyl-prolyl isomerase
MFADQATADKAAAELRTGKPFPKVFDAYRAKARDAQSYPGVFPKQLPPELAQALAALAPGQATKAPVKTSLGWHLLYLESVDPFEPPSLDKVKDRIRDALEQKQAQAYLDSLKQSASITLVAPANAASAPPEVPRQGMGKAVSPAPAKASSTAQ